MNADLNKMTLEDVIRYAAVGFELEINDGQVVRMVMRHEEGSDNGR